MIKKIIYSACLLPLFSLAQPPIYNVATNPAYPPFEFIDDRGEIVGLEIDILNAIAKNGGFSLNYYQHTWEGIFDDLQERKADIVASALVPSAIEGNSVMSNAYLVSKNCLGYMDDAHLQDWQNKRISIAAEEEIISDLLSVQYQVENFVPVKTAFLSLRAVAAGESDLLATDCNLLSYYANSKTIKRAGLNFLSQVVEDPEDDGENTHMVFAVRADDKEMLNRLNQGLQAIKSNGELDEIFAKWNVYN